jgi:hypothetical protein
LRERGGSDEQNKSEQPLSKAHTFSWTKQIGTPLATRNSVRREAASSLQEMQKTSN